MCRTTALASSVNSKSCECEVPGYQTKFNTEVSYTKFPNPGLAKYLQLQGYNRDFQYQR